MKKLILSAIALVSLTCHAVAQAPEGPSSTPVVTPPPVPTPMPAPPPVPTQPTHQKEKGEKHKGDSDKNKGGERAWENHRKTNKGKKEERGEEQGNRGQAKKAENEARKAERDAQGNHGQAKKAENEARKAERDAQGNHGQAKKAENEARKAERKAEQGERKEARAEKLDKMRAYLNLSPDQESQMSTAIQSFRTGAKAVKENKNWSPEQKKVQFDKLVAERNAQLKSILTPDQLAKLAEAQKQGMAQGKGKHGFISDELGDDDLF
jgi:colicin import membrane protein